MGAIPPSAILSRKGIARYGGVSCTGPLSSPLSWTWVHSRPEQKRWNEVMSSFASTLVLCKDCYVNMWDLFARPPPKSVLKNNILCVGCQTLRCPCPDQFLLQCRGWLDSVPPRKLCNLSPSGAGKADNIQSCTFTEWSWYESFVSKVQNFLQFFPIFSLGPPFFPVTKGRSS